MTFSAARTDLSNRSMHLLKAADVSRPFTQGSRPILQRKGDWRSPAPKFPNAKQQANVLYCLHSHAEQHTGHLSAQAQSGSAADNSTRSSQHVQEQSLLEPAASSSTGVGEQKPVSAKLGTLWGLLVLAVAYVHHSTTGYAWHAAYLLSFSGAAMSSWGCTALLGLL